MSDAREVARVLNSSAIHLLRAWRAVDDLAGLTPARLSALSVLHFGGPRPLGRLARDEGVSSPTMTRIVDGLVALGLAERREHPHNGRIVTVAATREGSRLMRAAAGRRLDRIGSAIESLDVEDQRALREAAGALEALVDAVRRQ